MGLTWARLKGAVSRTRKRWWRKDGKVVVVTGLLRYLGRLHTASAHGREVMVAAWYSDGGNQIRAF